MSVRPTRQDRRRFIRFALAGAIAAPLGGLIAPRRAGAAEKPKLDPDSERAQKLGYSHDATSIDDPKRKTDARCRNCAHFRGDEGDAWASCNVFPDRRVSADGWCASWIDAG